MKKKDWIYNTAIGVVAICIMVVVVFKFVLPEKSRQGGFAIKEFVFIDRPVTPISWSFSLSLFFVFLRVTSWLKN